MFKNYIKIAFRNLWKNKGYSALNIFGLAIGIACAALIFLWIEDEVSYDSNFTDTELIYKIPSNQLYEGEWRTFSQATPGPLAADLKSAIPGIEYIARAKQSDFLLNNKDKSINQSGWYVDPEYLDIFSLDFLEGSPQDALIETKSIIITRATADKLFGRGQFVLGNNINLNNKEDFIITGVVADLPENVTYDFEWLVPFRNFEIEYPWVAEYGRNFATTFIKLESTASFEMVDKGVRDFVLNKFDEDDTVFFLHAMKDWRLRSRFENGEQSGGRIQYVILFSIIALFIIVIASINFMNLATARSEKRANEVGVRKALGSEKRSLINQFIIEAVMTTLIAGVLGIGIIAILLPQYNRLVEKQLTMGWDNPLYIAGLLSITVVLGILSGLYPAFYLSSFKPVEVLKGINKSNVSANWIRKGLVVGQFVISIVFIISTFIVYEQLQHVKNRELGYDKENLIRIPVNGDIVKNFTPIKQELINSNDVEHIALSNSQILNGGNNGSGFTWQGGSNTEDVLISFRLVSSDFFQTTGIKIEKGRSFYQDMVRDSTSVIVSKSFAAMLGKSDIIGKKITRDEESYTVVGIAEDYIYGDMYGTSDPVMFVHNHDDARYLYVKLKNNTAISTTLSNIEKTLGRYNPAFPFEYEFVDTSFNERFKSENLVGKLSSIFAVLAIIISCLGLFGLSAYTAEQRRKEIGVRKVLGSSAANIVRLLSADFLKLVLLAVVIAVPAGYFLMDNWLQDYWYRIDIKLWVFAIAAVLALVIAFATVSFQAIKAAIANPIKSLRTE